MSIIKCIFLSRNIQKVGWPFLTSPPHHVAGEILENSVATILICRCQCGFGNRFASYAKKLTLGMMSLQSYHNVSQTFTIWELSKHHWKQLVPTWKVLHVLVSTILASKIVKVVSVQMTDQLRENVLTFVPCSLLNLAAMVQIQNRWLSKLLVKDSKSIISNTD